MCKVEFKNKGKWQSIDSPRRYVVSWRENKGEVFDVQLHVFKSLRDRAEWLRINEPGPQWAQESDMRVIIQPLSVTTSTAMKSGLKALMQW